MSGDAFLDAPCFCGHTRAEHRRPGSQMSGRCLVCTDEHYFAKPDLHERKVREAAFRADPTHVHGATHIVYVCPGFIPRKVCDQCGLFA